MDSRQQFEEWFEANKDFMLGTRKVSKPDCFFVWQASRSEIELDMPRSFSEDRHFIDVYEVEDVLEVIHAAGIRTK